MGLDMYLSAKTYVTTDTIDWASGDPVTTPTPLFTQLIELLNLPAGILDNAGYLAWIELPVGYWRKANAIHAWFIRNQKEDDCRGFDVELEELDELESLCKQILDDPAPARASELLPTQGGFFFGPTNLEAEGAMDWYLDDLRNTLAIIERARKFDALCRERKLFYFLEYRASW